MPKTSGDVVSDQAALMDVYMNVSFHARSPKLPWQAQLRAKLLERSTSQQVKARRSTVSGAIAAIAAAAAAKRGGIPQVTQWHQATQEHLFAQLRECLWPNDRSRVMVDLGAHAGHGRHRNVSDAMIWLHYFNHSGRVYAVDMVEDLAQDLQQRLDLLPPYRNIPSVRKESVAAALASVDDVERDMFWSMKTHVTCCAGNHTVKPWCALRADHLPPSPTISHDRRPSPTIADHLPRSPTISHHLRPRISQP